jgi:hypothetical protein
MAREGATHALVTGLAQMRCHPYAPAPPEERRPQAVDELPAALVPAPGRRFAHEHEPPAGPQRAPELAQHRYEVGFGQQIEHEAAQQRVEALRRIGQVVGVGDAQFPAVGGGAPGALAGAAQHGGRQVDAAGPAARILAKQVPKRKPGADGHLQDVLAVFYAEPL